MEQGFIQTIGLTELRISLADTTYLNTTIFQVPDLNLRQLGFFEKNFPL